MKKKNNEEFCPLCGEYMDVVCSVHREKQFIDGKKYNYICHTCFNVPKMYDYNEKTDKLIIYELMDPNRLSTVADMVSEGANAKLAEKSIKAVKQSIKKYLK